MDDFHLRSGFQILAEMDRRLEGLKTFVLDIILFTFINWIAAVDDAYAVTRVFRDSLVGKARQCCVDRCKHADKRYGW